MQISLRFVWFVLKYVLLGVLVFSLVWAGFFIAMDSTNAYVIASDGLKQRADVILGEEPSADLEDFFTTSFLASDPMLQNTPYSEYTIYSYTYNVTLKSIWCRPWQNTATLVFEEYIPYINGTRTTDQTDAQGNPVIQEAPAWPHTKYEVHCIKNSAGQWHVDSMEILEELEPVYTPTDEPNITPFLTPTPLPTTPVLS